MSVMRAIKTTSKELAYRDKHFHDIRVVKDRLIVCASCGNKLQIQSGRIYSHPLLGLLQCETCQKHFKNVEETSKKQSYCYLCGHHKKLFVCSDKDCPSAFCKNCIKRNTTLSLLDAENEDWKCFMCKSQPLWELRAVCCAVKNAFAKKCSKRNTLEIPKHSLPSQREKIAKTKQVQRSLRNLCDTEEDSTSETRLSFLSKSIKKGYSKESCRSDIMEMTIEDSSDMTSDDERNRINKAKTDKANSSANSKDKSARGKYSSDSDDSFTVSSDDSIKRQRTKKSQGRFTAQQKSGRKNRVIDSSDCSSDNNNFTSGALTASSSSKRAAQQEKKKDARSHNAREAKNKVKKYVESSTSEKRERHNNSKGQASHKEDDTDSSSKEFQREKLLHRKPSPLRRLKDLEVGYTESPAQVAQNSSSDCTTDNKRPDLTFNDMKNILIECKTICSSFKHYINIVEALYEKEDEDNLVLLSRKVSKFTTALNKKEKELSNFHESWSNRSKKGSRGVTRKVHEAVSNKGSSEEAGVLAKPDTESRDLESKRNSREVSECDSDEIFSVDENRLSQTMLTSCDTGASKVNNDLIKTDSDREKQNMSNDLAASSVLVNNKPDKTDGDNDQQNKSKDGEKRRESTRDKAASPILGTLEAGLAERSIKEAIPGRDNDIDNEASSKSKNADPRIGQSESVDSSNRKNETEDPSSKEGLFSKEGTLLNNHEQNGTENVTINKSFDDMFDSSSDNLPNTKDRTVSSREKNAETSGNKVRSTPKAVDNIEACEAFAANRADDAAADCSEGTGSNDPGRANESHQLDLDMTEALAKKSLLESDSDNDLPDASPSKEVGELILDDTAKKSTTEEIESDASTVVLSKSPSKNLVKTVNTKADAKNNGESSRNKKGTDEKTKEKTTKNETSSYSDEDAKAERIAKKSLLADSSSDDSRMSSPLLAADDEGKNESDDNIKAKKALLASSSSDSSSSDSETLRTEIMASRYNKRTGKRKIERDSDSSSIISAVKRRRLQLHKNVYYMSDKKLRMTCEVRVMQLPNKFLKRYFHALQKSKMHQENKALQSLVNLDNLEKRHRNARKDTDAPMSDDDDAPSKAARRSNKERGKQDKEEEESLMDHLKRVENDDLSAVQVYSSDESDDRLIKLDAAPVSNEALLLEANKTAKRNLLDSSDSDVKEMVSDNDNSDINEKSEDNKKKSQKKAETKASKQNENNKEKSGKSNWRRNKLLTMQLSDTDSDIQEKKWNKKQEKLKKEEELKKEANSDSDEEESQPKKKKGGRRIIYSDSDVKLTDCDSDSDDFCNTKKHTSDSSVISLDSATEVTKKEKEKPRRRARKRRDSKSSATDSSLEEKRPKPKRKRIKKMASDSDSDSDVIQTSQGTPSKSGRKNIRKVLKDKQVADDTKQAAKEEEERLKRIADRQALYNEMYEMRLAGEEKIDKLVLDFDTETKEELVSVHENLVKRLKPHQAQGIKFMWDACFESLERIKSTPGSGCIIAHCMGLGKTLQVVALTHTLLNHELTGIKTVLVVCPLSTVLNWANEYKIWLSDLDDDIDIYELTKFKKNFERKYQLQRWQQTGGILIIGYEMFRNLSGSNKNIRKAMKEAIQQCLIDPGPDLIVCDEGHLLKNEDTALSKCIRQVKTMRRIVLTGTPLQNNLTEYHCMVQFVKPNLLGTKKEFLNRFVNPITNGQFDDSTAYDVKLMKKRAHVLHKMLEGSVQRFDYSVLTPFLPPKQEYVIFVRLTETQIKMYQYYLANLARHHHGAGGSLFADFQSLQRVWTHPIVLRLNAEKIEKANEKKFDSESEGSLKDFINDDSTDVDSSSCESNSSSDVQAIDDEKGNLPKRKTRNNPGDEESEPEVIKEVEVEWWAQFVQPEHFEDMRVSAKLLLLFSIIKECEQIGDKVLVFSQSLYSLTLIEHFLRRIDDKTQENTSEETLDNHSGSWSLGLDYFRLDGQTSADNRSLWCKIFNRPTNTRARLFLISTRAGGLGINLTAANRVIIFDASWNPSHDVQSIFRVYRFGQKKPCYVYRFLAAGTMEEKIYNRQVTKLSLSCRVVDEQQIERHYSNHNLNELYTFESYDKEKPTLNLPKDRLLAEIFLKYKDVVENYHEHDSLLENKAEEELDEEERKQAWLEYEEEKKGKPMMVYQNNMLQQYNMFMNTADQTGLLPQNFSMQVEYENLQQLICKDYPNSTPEQQKAMTNRALLEMYNYWEQQAVLQPVTNRVQLPTYQPRFPMPQPATSSNVPQQLNPMLLVNSVPYVNQTAQSGINMIQKPAYRNIPINNVRKADDDIIKMTPSTSNVSALNTQVAQGVQPAAATNKNQEE